MALEDFVFVISPIQRGKHYLESTANRKDKDGEELMCIKRENDKQSSLFFVFIYDDSP